MSCVSETFENCSKPKNDQDADRRISACWYEKVIDMYEYMYGIALNFR